MKEIPIPADSDERAKLLNKLQGRRKRTGVVALVCGALALGLLIAFVVVLIVAEFKTRGQLFYILSGAFLGGTVLFAALAYFLNRFCEHAVSVELDYRERCDGEESFFVGNGTLASFGESSLRIFAEGGEGEEVFVPYEEMRFLSVCTRHSPRAKGEWSVVFEIPVRYVAKKGDYQESDPPALVQTDAKERLYNCLKAHGLELIGELFQPAEEKQKPVLLKKYVLSNPKANLRAIVYLALGALLVGGGVPVAIYLNLVIGAVMLFLGLFFLCRAPMCYFGARSKLAFYEGGVFWKDKNRTGSYYLKWEDVKEVSRSVKRGFSFLDVVCEYGVFHYPDPSNAYEFVRERFPEKCKGGKA